MPDRPVPAPTPPPVVCNACQAITAKQTKHCKHCEWWYCPVCHALNSKTDFNPPGDIAGSYAKVVEWAKKHGITTRFGRVG
jgi:hypothetical protein